MQVLCECSVVIREEKTQEKKTEENGNNKIIFLNSHRLREKTRNIY